MSVFQPNVNIDVFPKPSTFFFETGVSLNLELTDAGGRAGQKAPGSSCLSLHSSAGYHITMPVFRRVLGTKPRSSGLHGKLFTN